MDEKLEFKNVDEYISLFPKQAREIMQKLRATILKVAPGANEKISYKMPAYEFKGPLVYFAAYKNHIGFYPAGSGIEEFKERLADYKTSKGTIQFPLDKPVPWDLIIDIVKFRVGENLSRNS